MYRTNQVYDEENKMIETQIKNIIDTENKGKEIVFQAKRECEKILYEGENTISTLKVNNLNSLKILKKDKLANAEILSENFYKENIEQSKKELSTKKNILKLQITKIVENLTKEILDRWL